ncbi:hypothetical protein CEXT_177821 [Caerostris extrusa]|uniref:Uncharacterized protein n=1 Tax=Caerostris extrusa TaxID=172846 RepID=A0AAV4MRE7_CAEEX|nr:hypothetical protein CEXT_177821 [Caerostris extrusa]
MFGVIYGNTENNFCGSTNSSCYSMAPQCFFVCQKSLFEKVVRMFFDIASGRKNGKIRNKVRKNKMEGEKKINKYEMDVHNNLL